MLAILTSTAFVTSAYAAVSGMSLATFAAGLFRPRPLLGFIVLILLSWGFTIWRHLQL